MSRQPRIESARPRRQRHLVERLVLGAGNDERGRALRGRPRLASGDDLLLQGDLLRGRGLLLRRNLLLRLREGAWKPDLGAGIGRRVLGRPFLGVAALAQAEGNRRRARVDHDRPRRRRLAGDDVGRVAGDAARDAPGKAGLLECALDEDVRLTANVRDEQRRGRSLCNGRVRGGLLPGLGGKGDRRRCQNEEEPCNCKAWQQSAGPHTHASFFGREGHEV